MDPSGTRLQDDTAVLGQELENDQATTRHAACIYPQRRIEQNVCYLLAIGANADPLRLGALFEEQLEADIGAAQGTIAAAFPSESVVRTLTYRGCSCDLLEGVAPAGATAAAGSIYLTRACRHAIAVAAMELGTVSIYVKSRGGWQLDRIPRLAMTVGELLESRASVPTNVLIDIVIGIPPAKLN